MGFYIGIGGVVTFKNAKKCRRTVEEIPLTHIVLETDCPYMSPEPNRGARNDSANLVYVAEKIAELKDTTIEEVIRVTTQNAEALYRLDLTPEQQKVAKEATKTGTRKTPTNYKFDKKKRPKDAEKVEFLEKVCGFCSEITENCEIVNAGQEISFKIGENDVQDTNVCHFCWSVCIWFSWHHSSV